jgi:hypothetical protein
VSGSRAVARALAEEDPGMMAHETTATESKPNVKLLVFAAMTMLVAIAGITRSLQLAAEDEAAEQEAAIVAEEIPAGDEG